VTDMHELLFSVYAPNRRSAAEEEEAQRTSGFYSQPGPAVAAAGGGKKDGASSSSSGGGGGGGSGGVGKYLGGGGHVTTLPRLPAGGNGVGPALHPRESLSLQQQAVEGKKKKEGPAALGGKTAFKNFDGW
jgi:hypothetical protein